jgi:hypothetical protein
VVVEVVRASLGRRGLSAVHIVSPPSPERGLLADWFGSAGIPVRPEPDGDGRGSTLAVHAANKLQLLMEAPLAPCIPLGDVWWSQLRSWCGDATVPASLRHLPRSAAARVEEALRRCVEGGEGMATALAPLPSDLRSAVEGAYRRSGGWGHPVLIPKLTEWTWGIDPHF